MKLRWSKIDEKLVLQYLVGDKWVSVEYHFDDEDNAYWAERSLIGETDVHKIVNAFGEYIE